MKRQTFKTLMLTLLVSLGGTLQVAVAQDVIKKTYHKEYTAADGTVLVVLNKYGDVNFEDWAKKTVVIDVTISVDNPDRERAQKMLEFLDVDFSQDGNRIQAKTTIDDRFSRYGWNRWGKEGKKFSIDYTIHAPASIDVELMNKYGNTFVSKLSGHALLSVKYGNLKVNSLTRADTKPLNMIELAYGKGIIDEANWLKLDVKYAKLEISSAQAVAGVTGYSKLTMGDLSSLVVESKYDGYKLGKLNNLVLDIAYGNVSAEEVNQKFSVQSRYTGINVDRVPAGFSSITIENKYGGISLGLDPNASYNLDGEARYSKISVPESSQLSRIIESSSASYKGLVGSKAKATAMVKIETSYGNIKLHQ